MPQLMPWPGGSKGTFRFSNQATSLPITCLPHTAEASHCPFYGWTSSRVAVNIKLYTLWFNPTWSNPGLPFQLQTLYLLDYWSIDNGKFQNEVSLQYIMIQAPFIVGRAATRSSLEGNVWSSNFRPIKSDSVFKGSPPLQYFSGRSCVACRRNDAEMGPANSLHAPTLYSE